MPKSLLIIVLAICQTAAAQKAGNTYYAIDTLGEAVYSLHFTSDSSVAFSNMQTGADSTYATVACTRNGNTLLLHTGLPTQPTITLVKKGEVLLNRQDTLLYVNEQRYRQRHAIIYIINGRRYIDKSPAKDKLLSPKEIRRAVGLQQQLERAAAEPHNYRREQLGGLPAYNRFGLTTIFGATVITRLQ